MPQSTIPKKGDVLLLAGTQKGALILAGDRLRKSWSVSEMYLAGGEVFHLTYDAREGGTVYAAVNHAVWGPELQLSRDLGATWQGAAEGPRFDSDAGTNLKRLWHVQPGRHEEPGVVYLGVEPAALFKSEDAGSTWHEVAGLSQHSTRELWQPGRGGLCLHSIVLDPSRIETLWVGVSAVGVFRSDDGGRTWHTKNSGIRADYLPDPFPEFGQCPHKVLPGRASGETLFTQTHCGVFRSDTGADEWDDISEGLPSRFGFALGLHSHDPDTLYVIPEDRAIGDVLGGMTRYVTDTRFRVFRSRNRGADWEPLTDGLPQENAYLHVLREGMAVDSLDPCGIYVGATTGQIFHSRDDGDSWELMIDHLPPINSLECTLV